MNAERKKLTLDRRAVYEICVPGVLDASWVNSLVHMTVSIEDGDSPVTIMSGTLDQAALHSLLRRLYGLGLPLISVICVE